MKLLLLALEAGCLWGQTPGLDEIMRRVALNQAKSQDLRESYVYRQTQVLRLARGSGKVAREEHREYSIAPKARGLDRKLIRFDGRYQSGGKYVSYGKPGYRYKNVDIDGELVDSMAEEMMHDRGSRDGISPDLFPLTYHQQLRYDFTLEAGETYRGRRVYRVRFVPKRKPSLDDLDGNGGIWKGEALIDAEEYQPVKVTTELAWKAPLAVKTLLGTNVHGVGFAVSYQKVADGVWFPVSYGGEFHVRAAFFYERTISVAMTNSDFRRTDVASNVTYALEEK
jgi:hypothetical protein